MIDTAQHPGTIHATRWAGLVAAASTLAWLLFAVAHGLLGRSTVAAVEAGACLVNALLLLGALRWSSTTLMRAELLLNIPALGVVAALSGGIESLAIWWLPLVAMSAALELDRIEALAWALLSIAAAAVAAWSADTGLLPVEYRPGALELLLGHSGLVLCLLCLPWLYRRDLSASRRREQQQLSELRQNHERIATLQTTLDEHRRQQRNLLQMIHHSLRTSTTAAAGAVELLADLESGLSTRQRQLVDVARRHSARLRDEIRDLLDARELLDQDPKDVELERHDLVSLIRTHLVKRDQVLAAVTVADSASPVATIDAATFVLALHLLASTTQQYGANAAEPPDIIIDDDAIRLLMQISARASSVDAEQDSLRRRLAEALLIRSSATLAVTATDQA